MSDLGLPEVDQRYITKHLPRELQEEIDRWDDVEKVIYLLPPSLLLEAELIAHAVSQQISIDASSFLPCPLSGLPPPMVPFCGRPGSGCQLLHSVRQSDNPFGGAGQKRVWHSLSSSAPPSLSTSLPLFLFFDTCSVLAAQHTNTTRMHALQVSILPHGAHEKF